jgi:hypothetical protein
MVLLQPAFRDMIESSSLFKASQLLQHGTVPNRRWVNIISRSCSRLRGANIRKRNEASVLQPEFPFDAMAASTVPFQPVLLTAEKRVLIKVFGSFHLD